MHKLQLKYSKSGLATICCEPKFAEAEVEVMIPHAPDPPRMLSRRCYRPALELPGRVARREHPKCAHLRTRRTILVHQSKNCPFYQQISGSEKKRVNTPGGGARKLQPGPPNPQTQTPNPKRPLNETHPDRSPQTKLRTIYDQLLSGDEDDHKLGSH